MEMKLRLCKKMSEKNSLAEVVYKIILVAKIYEIQKLPFLFSSSATQKWPPMLK